MQASAAIWGISGIKSKAKAIRPSMPQFNKDVDHQEHLLSIACYRKGMINRVGLFQVEFPLNQGKENAFLNVLHQIVNDGKSMSVIMALMVKWYQQRLGSWMARRKASADQK